jgi:hypothetical protein
MREDDGASSDSDDDQQDLEDGDGVQEQAANEATEP